jgi:uncharacterized lipoprotein YmbA
MRSLSLTAMVLTLALVGGCASSPRASFYTLSPERPQEHADAGAQASRTPVAITIGAVTVPDIVDRPQLVLRVNANEVMIDEFARWPDSLKSQIRQVIAADLAMDFPGAFVSGYPQNVDSALTYQVSIDVQRFESVPGEAAAVSVLWSVRSPKGAAVSGQTIVHEATAGAGYDALVAAHSRAMAAVGWDVATAVRSTLRQ